MSDIQEKMTISGTSTCLDDLGIRELIAENERMKSAFRYLLSMTMDQVSPEARNVIRGFAI